MEGRDACRKICILAAIAFGRHIYPQQVPTEGISGVTLADVAYAESCNRKIKLLGRAVKEPDGRVCAYVAPHLVDAEAPLAGVEDVFNAIMVKGDAIGDVMFYGGGRGSSPPPRRWWPTSWTPPGTSSPGSTSSGVPAGRDVTVSPDQFPFRWYVRAAGSAAAVRTAFPGAALLSRPGAPAEEVAFLTAGAMTRAQLDAALGDLRPCPCSGCWRDGIGCLGAERASALSPPPAGARPGRWAPRDALRRSHTQLV